MSVKFVIWSPHHLRFLKRKGDLVVWVPTRKQATRYDDKNAAIIAARNVSGSVQEA